MVEEVTKRPVGRPRKHPIPEKEVQINKRKRKHFSFYKKRLKKSFDEKPQYWIWIGTTIMIVISIVLVFLFILKPLVLFKLDTDRYYKYKADMAYNQRKAELENDYEKKQLKSDIIDLKEDKSELKGKIKLRDDYIAKLEEDLSIKDQKIAIMIITTNNLLEVVGSPSRFYEKNGRIHYSGDDSDSSRGGK